MSSKPSRNPQDASLAARAKLAGFAWDDRERQWTKTLPCGMRAWLSSKGLIEYLSEPKAEPTAEVA